MPANIKDSWEGNHIIDSLFLMDIDSVNMSEAIEYFDCKCILSILNPPECRCMSKEEIIDKYNIDWLWIQFEDTFLAEGSFQPVLHKCADWMHRTIDIEHMVCFVHCWAGVSRSTTIVIAYLIKYHSDLFNAETASGVYSQALEFVREKRSKVSPNFSFSRELILFAENIAEKSNNNDCQCIIL